MELTWTTLILTIAGALVAWFWQDSLRVREAANDAAIDACTKMGLQFLDGTVAFSHLRLIRDAGRLRLRRTYVFDYTSHSIDRLQGFVVLLAGQVESVGFARTEQRAASGDIVYPPTPSYPPSPPSSDLGLPQVDRSDRTADGKNVLDLDAWRKTRQR